MVLQQIPDRWERSKSSSREKNKKQEIVQSGPEEPKNLYIMGKRVKKKTKLWVPNSILDF